MDYEKEYKNLVAKVKKAHQFAQTDSTKSVLEDIFPQLRESEYKTKSALGLIAEERERQIIKGFNWKHDDEHDCHQLSDAAIVYAAPAPLRYQVMKWWPWDKKCLKEDDSFTTEGRIGELVKAGALIVAEIERLQRTINNVTKPNESEDERIRKYLIEELKAAKSVGELKFIIPQPTREECIAYLEKQKEQKHPNGCFTCDEYKKGYEEGRRNGFTAGYNKAMKEVEQKEQKPAWSEEDEKIYQHCLIILHDYGYDEWFKSLRPQPKEEWSEEDKKHINPILRILDRQQCWDGATGKKFNPYQDEIDWLKSLRPSWKPSEEQMEALETAERWYSDNMGCNLVLASLVEQLKKL